MTNIALVLPSIRFGLRYWTYIIEALERQGCTVTVFTGLAPQAIPRGKKIVCCGGRLVTVRRNPKGYDWMLTLVHPRIAWDIAKMAPDVVLVVEYTSATLLAFLGARMCGARFLIFQEHSARWGFKPGAVKRLWRKMLLKASDLIIANTEEAMREIWQLYPAYRAKIRVVPLLVPPDRGEMMKKEAELPRESPRPIFAYVGQLIPGKNVACIVDAAEILKRLGYRFSVWIVGNGPEKPKLQRVVTSKGLEDTVRFVDALPYESVGFVYAKSDVFVMPTLSDYRSMAVLEAMRFAKPIIDSTRDGNAGSLVVDGQNGFIFNPYDAEELADRMRRFIDFPNLIVDMGRESERKMWDLRPQKSAKLLVKALQETM